MVGDNGPDPELARMHAQAKSIDPSLAQARDKAREVLNDADVGFFLVVFTSEGEKAIHLFPQHFTSTAIGVIKTYNDHMARQLLEQAAARQRGEGPIAS